MSKKKKKKRYVITSKEMFDFEKPKYNAFAGGYGAHGSSKYDRNAEKRKWRREMNDSDAISV